MRANLQHELQAPDHDLPQITAALSGPAQARSRIRQGEHIGHTSGLAEGYVQGNIVILPQAMAGDFLLYCQRNPKPCPLLAVSEPGQPLLPTLGADIDIRSGGVFAVRLSE